MMAIPNIPVFSLLASNVPYLIFIFLLYILFVAIYRLFLSSLACIPGPKLAALTSLYEFYHDCVHPGQFYFQIQKLHTRYGMINANELLLADGHSIPLLTPEPSRLQLTFSGPIIRIGPYEVHIADPHFFDRIYNVTTKFEKYGWYYRFGNLPLTSFGTIDADLHRLRRSPLAKHFSPANIIKLDPLIKDSVALLCRRLEEHRQAKKVVDLGNAYRCIVADIVSEYVIPVAPTLLEDENFAADYNVVLRDFAIIGTFNRHLGWLFPLMQAMPRWLVSIVAPAPALAVYDNLKRVEEQARMVIHSGGAPPPNKKFPVVLNSIYHSDLPPAEKSHQRLTQDAFALVSAGSETTSLTLTTTTFHLLSNPNLLTKLQNELREYFPTYKSNDTISYRALEKLPYLTACINEGLRLGSGVSGRLPRIDPHGPTKYGGYTLPAGTVISMCIRDIHYDASIYPDPRSFNPERWLEHADGEGEGEKARKRKERYLVPFGKGARSCVASNLAMAELYAVLGNVFRRFGDGGIELWETGREDVEMKLEFFSPVIGLESKGLRVLIG